METVEGCWRPSWIRLRGYTLKYGHVYISKYRFVWVIHLKIHSWRLFGSQNGGQMGQMEAKLYFRVVQLKYSHTKSYDLRKYNHILVITS